MSLKKKNKVQENGASEPEGKNYPCYFCNESFEMGLLQNHLTTCGSILEQCSLRCGAWIQRKNKDSHMDDCKNQKNKNAPSHARPPDSASPSGHTWSPDKVSIDDCVSYLETEVNNIKLVLTGEVTQRELQERELDTIHAKLGLLEERTQHFLSTVMNLRSVIDDGGQRNYNMVGQLKHDVANLQISLQELENQQSAASKTIESAVTSIIHEQKERELLEQALMDHEHRIRAIQQLEEVIEYIKASLEEERQTNARSREVLESELLQARRASEQLNQIQGIRSQLQMATDSAPAIDRISVLEVTTADVRAEISELSAKVDTLLKEQRALTKSYLKVRNELTDFQANVTFGSQELGSDDGHLIWKIDNYATRMKEAKETDSVLSSPLFRTNRYGYTLKAELHLNGIGKWKGRHLTCTVRLVSGPYDALLHWPCDLNINIVLKDQPGERHEAMDIVKSLDLRRKSSSKRHDYDLTAKGTETTETPEKTTIQYKRQYIFIPHSSLDKFDYVKNDVMFIEFNVNQ